MKTLLLEAQLRSFKRTADGGVDFTFRSGREVPNDEFALVDQYFHQSGWLAFQMDEINPDIIPKEQAKIKGQISDSQYLRNCLFAKHMAMGGTKENFTAYYHKAMAGFATAVNDSYER